MVICEEAVKGLVAPLLLTGRWRNRWGLIHVILGQMRQNRICLYGDQLRLSPHHINTPWSLHCWFSIEPNIMNTVIYKILLYMYIF